jgi:hypothetical protein
MVFAFTPDDRPARLMRYVDRGTLPDATLVCIYIHEQNLLIIDKDHFAALNDNDKRTVLRTHHPYHEIGEFELRQAA